MRHIGMRKRIAAGLGLVALTTSLTLTVTGIATSQLTAGLVGPPAAAAAEKLVPFEDCEELRRWYVREALPDVGAYGFEGGGWPGWWARDVMMTRDLPAVRSPGALRGVAQASAEDAVTSSDTGTNVQEAGVDEPDRAKTDGVLVVHLRRSTVVVTDVSGVRPREVGALSLPRQLGVPELLLDGDRVLVLGTAPTGFWGGPLPLVDLEPRMAPADQTTRMIEVSILDPAEPRIESDQTFDGNLVSARSAGGTVRLVLRTGLPTLDFVYPNRDRTEREATAANRRIVGESEIEDWLPSVRSGRGEREPLVDCGDVRHPRVGAGFGTLTVVTLPTGDPDEMTSTAVTAGGDLAYSSVDRLYLATRAPKGATEIHAFALDGPSTTYVGSGAVRGVVADRWSLDEHEGHLRVAVGLGQGWTPTDNGVVVLGERDGDLVQLGAVRGLGPREEIKAVRWFDDLAVLVTFRQTDPLYTVDLTDPARPRTLGELKIPGFSEYLHPIGDDLLLGLGRDATARGEVREGQASLFDLGSVRDPKRLDTLGLGARAEPAVSHDPRAFTWLDDRSTALTAVTEGWNGRSSLVEIRVRAGVLTEGRRWSLPRWRAGEGRALPLPGGAVALVGSEVRVVEVGH